MVAVVALLGSAVLRRCGLRPCTRLLRRAVRVVVRRGSRLAVPDAAAARSPPTWLPAAGSGGRRRRVTGRSRRPRAWLPAMRACLASRRCVRRPCRHFGRSWPSCPRCGLGGAVAAAASAAGSTRSARRGRRSSAEAQRLQHVAQLVRRAAEDRHHLRRRPEAAVAGRALGRRARIGGDRPPGQQRRGSGPPAAPACRRAPRADRTHGSRPRR